MIRLIHAADLHLDAPFAALSTERGSERRRFIRCECFFVDAACAHDQNTQYRKGNREYRGLRDLYIYQIVVCVL